MLHSVRAGGIAAAVFVASLFGAAPAQATEIPAVVEAPAVAVEPIVEVAPIKADLAGQPLEQLAATLASAEVTGVDHECLAVAVYFEARGEPLPGQLAVAEVVLNRSRSGRYPADICAVVKQPAQFSFVRKGVFPRADRTSASWSRAVAVSRIALDDLSSQLPDNVLWYHADYVAPSWGKRLTAQARIGLHIFYS
jgi:spore germination cell wall hydrolase CwlJ-like protein